MNQIYKVTIKHFLNKKLKSVKVNGQQHWPVYFQVTTRRKSLQLKSIEVKEYLTDETFNSFLKSDQNSCISNESKTVFDIINCMNSLDFIDDSIFHTTLFSLIHRSFCHTPLFTNSYRNYSNTNENLSEVTTNLMICEPLKDFIKKNQIVNCWAWFKPDTQSLIKTQFYELLKQKNNSKDCFLKVKSVLELNTCVFHFWGNYILKQSSMDYPGIEKFNSTHESIIKKYPLLFK